MDKKTYDHYLSILKNYAHNHLGIKRLEVSSRILYDYYLPTAKSIAITTNEQKKHEIIYTLLHELGHAFEEKYYRNHYHSWASLRAWNKMERRRALLNSIDKGLSSLMESENTYSKSLKNAFNKVIEGKTLTKRQKKLYNSWVASNGCPDKLRKDIIMYKKSKRANLTDSQKRALCKRELMAWEYGKFIAECCGIILDKKYDKVMKDSLKTYEEEL